MGRPLDEVLRIVSEKTRQRIDSPAARVLRGGAVLGLLDHTVLVARDGSERAISHSAAPIRGRDGRTAGMVLVLRDATEERAARRALAHEAELLRNLYDAVISLDAEHVIRTWNTAAERIYGLTAQEAIGRRMSEILPSEYKGYSFTEFVEALDRTDRFRYEVRRRLRDGSWVDVEASAVVLRNDGGRITRYVTVNRDVTVRRRAEVALRASQERLSRVLETSNEAIWIVDAQGRTEFVNTRAAEFFGVSQDEMLGRPLLDFVSEAGRATTEADMASLPRGESIRREFTARRPDGSEVSIEMSRSALRDPDGRVVGAVGVFMDVTEHRRAREQLLRAQKMDAVGRLASGIAHDFNNLLVVILSCSGFLLESLPDGDPRQTDVAEIKQAGERAARLVRQLLAFGRKSVFQPISTDLNAVVQGMEKLLRRTIGEDIAMSVSLVSEPWLTHIDPGQFEQVLLNLVVNARDAMPGGGEIRIGTSNVTIERPPPGCEALASGRYAVLSVSDEGCGMAPEVLSRIFEPFFTTKDKGKGTGLGLSTAYGIVEQARGRIAVASEPGKGTTFTVYLPTDESAAREELKVEETPRERGHGQTVLVVEDEDAVRRVARRMLEENGFSVLEAGCVAEGLRRLQDDSVDLVLTDVIMPQGSGTDLEAAAAELRPNVPVVLMSGYSDWQRASARSGRVLVKPFTADALVARIHEALASGGRGGGPPQCPLT
jgi:PAS domain S-box-containing protein